MILNNQTRPTRSYQFDNADNAILFSARKRPRISKSYAESHLSLLEDMNRCKQTISESITESLQKVSGKVWKIDIKSLPSIGLISYVSELGRGISKPNFSIGSGYFYNELDGYQISDDHVYIVSKKPIEKDVISDVIAYSVAEEIVATIESLSSENEIQMKAEKVGTNLILTIPNGKRLVTTPELENTI
ncbi:hypothetical protein FPV63_06675 [Vibrio cholerae]|uniref:hypothetical protein n=1 Tax=Vibrio parahaemolyticus TaxID=670 RepID=UPI00119152E2|nr:hypothetical protein [Vibrio parahaemolyticus]TVN06964.1 hypothetical protein FPV63_06675 [Vibrio cholerae]